MELAHHQKRNKPFRSSDGPEASPNTVLLHFEFDFAKTGIQEKEFQKKKIQKKVFRRKKHKCRACPTPANIMSIITSQEKKKLAQKTAATQKITEKQNEMVSHEPKFKRDCSLIFKRAFN